MKLTRSEKGGVLLQVITTASVSLMLVGSITLMLRNQAKKFKIEEFIKKRNGVAQRVSDLLVIPEVLWASAKSLPVTAQADNDELHGNYVLGQCLGLNFESEDSYEETVSGDHHQTGELVLQSKNCILRELGENLGDQSWYPLLVISSTDFMDLNSDDMLGGVESGSSCSYQETFDKWSQDLSCFVAGHTEGENARQVAYSFDGEPGSLDKSHPLKTSVYFRPICDDDNLVPSCYIAKKIQIKYKIEHVWDESLLPDCKLEDTIGSLGRCKRNSPIKLGAYPKNQEYYLEITPSDILDNQCNSHATLEVFEDGGVACQCVHPYRQSLAEKNGQVFYKKNHKGPLCELIEPFCNDSERLVGQTPDGLPLCERIEEDLLSSGSSEKKLYEFQKTFLSLDSPIYSGTSGAKYASNICNSTTALDEGSVCSFYSCRYYDENGDGTIQEDERVDGWLNHLDVDCESYLKFNKTEMDKLYPSVSYYEELVWGVTEQIAAVFLAFSENILWIPRLLTQPSDKRAPKNYSMLQRRDLIFPNVGERLYMDTRQVKIQEKMLNIPYCNVKTVLADNAPADGIVTDDPRCPLVVCKYTMTCHYAGSNRIMPSK